MAYSMDFRRAVAAAHECGSSAEVAEQFGCSESWVRQLVQHRRERGTRQPAMTELAPHQGIQTSANNTARITKITIAAMPNIMTPKSGF